MFAHIQHWVENDETQYHHWWYCVFNCRSCLIEETGVQTTRRAAGKCRYVLSSAVCPPQVTPSNPDDFEQGHDAGTFVQTALADKTLQLAPTYQVTCAAFPSFPIAPFPFGRWINMGGQLQIRLIQKQLTNWSVVLEGCRKVFAESVSTSDHIKLRIKIILYILESQCTLLMLWNTDGSYPIRRNGLIIFQGFNCTTNVSHISTRNSSHRKITSCWLCALQP